MQHDSLSQRGPGLGDSAVLDFGNSLVKLTVWLVAKDFRSQYVVVHEFTKRGTGAIPPGGDRDSVVIAAGVPSHWTRLNEPVLPTLAIVPPK